MKATLITMLLLHRNGYSDISPAQVYIRGLPPASRKSTVGYLMANRAQEPNS